MQNKESKFNWKLPLYGAVGFGIGTLIEGIIYRATDSLFLNIIGLIGFMIMGAIGGAALGLALKDKRMVFYLSCAGAAGSIIGFVIGDAVIDIVKVYIIGEAAAGAILGFALGLALKDKKTYLYLSCAGAVGFAAGYVIADSIWFAIGNAAYAIWGIIGGAALGLALAYENKSIKI